MSDNSQPRESDLELVTSLTAEDVDAIDGALLAELSQEWRQSSAIVAAAVRAMRHRYRSVPDVFFAYRLRTLIKRGAAQSDAPAKRGEVFGVRSVEA